MPSSIDFYTAGIMEKATLSIIAGSEATGFEIEKAADFNPDTYWKPSSVISAYSIKIDLGEVKAVNGVWVFLRNYDTDYDNSTRLITLESCDDDDGLFTPATFRLATTFSNTVGDPIYIPDSAFAAVSRRYWRFGLASWSTITPQFAVIALYRKRSLTVGNQFPEDDSRDYATERIEGFGGRSVARMINSNRAGDFSRRFLFPSSTDMDTLNTVFDDCKKNTYPLVMVEDTNQRLVRFADNKLIPNQLEYNLFAPTVRFEELPYRGDGEAF